jgi:RimJ/RimL family protein N-acetyltransferase
MTTMELVTERLLLRDIREGDEALIAAHFAEPASQKQILSRQRNSDHWHLFVQGALLVQKQPERKHFSFTVVIAETQQAIGVCTLTHAWRESPHARMGWHLGSAFAGGGYATEMASELLALAFTRQDILAVISDCFADNEAQLKVLSKLGMKPHKAASLLKWLLPITYGEFRPITRLVIRKEEWFAQTAAAQQAVPGDGPRAARSARA